MMQRISKSQHPIAKKWQCYGVFMLLSFMGYFVHFIFAGAYTFGGDGHPIAFIAFINNISFCVSGFCTYGIFLGQKGWKFISGLCISGTTVACVIILLILTIDSKNNDCHDIFDCPMYGDMSVGLLVFLYCLGLPFPCFYFAAMILAMTPHWDPNKVPEEGEEHANAAVVVEANPGAEIPYMDPNAGNMNNPYALSRIYCFWRFKVLKHHNSQTFLPIDLLDTLFYFSKLKIPFVITYPHIGNIQGK